MANAKRPKGAKQAGSAPKGGATPRLVFEVTNFRCVGGPPDAKPMPIDLGPLTVVLGPNGAGKTTLVDAIEIFARAAQPGGNLGPLLNAMGGFDDLVHRQDPARRIGFRFEHRGMGLAYLFEAARGGAATVAIALDKLVSRDRGAVVERKKDRTLVQDAKDRKLVDFGFSEQLTALSCVPDDSQRHPEASRLRAFLGDIVILRLSPQACRTPGRAPARRMNSDGSGLAEVAMRIRQEHPDTWTEVSGFVAAAVPGLVKVQPVVGGDAKLVIQGHVSGLPRPVPAHLLSDGTLLMLAIACACFDPDPPSLLIIEEPDRSVHARMQEMIVQALRAASKRTTVIATTHATGLLAHARSLDELLLVEPDTGGTRFVRPKAGGKLRGWVEEHGLASAYETGLLGGVP